MNENKKPYSYEPDVLFIKLPTNLKSLEIEHYVSLWGVTDEKLCFFNGCLIGIVLEESSSKSEIFVNLLPKLDSKRDYPWPSSDEYLNSLQSLLRIAEFWEVHCERDADQNVVKELNNLDEVIAALNEVEGYGRGKKASCIDFHAKFSSF